MSPLSIFHVQVYWPGQRLLIIRLLVLGHRLCAGVAQSLIQIMSVAANVLAVQVDVGARILPSQKSPNLMCIDRKTT